MSAMSSGRATRRGRRRRAAQRGVRAEVPAPAVAWGRIGSYEAVSRDGILYLLAPRPGHPARRVTADA